MDALAAVRDTVDALAGLTRGQVTVGIIGSISSPSLDLPGLLAGFHHDHPGIEITLTEAGSDALIGALRAGRLDVALVSAWHSSPNPSPTPTPPSCVASRWPVPSCAGASHSPGGRNSPPAPQPGHSSTTHAGNSPARAHRRQSFRDGKFRQCLES